ncbi:MAG: hypothetical protein K8I60_05765, partial [Anaerolineae bacterium]|nr:hypothetical protein [Anaerolineae bacterium]
MSSSNIPSKQDFATEVRADRLGVLWKVTLGGAFILFWILFSIATLQKIELWGGFIALLSLVLGCLGARFFIQKDRFPWAVWSYALGAVFSVGIAMAKGEPTLIQLLPFVFPVIVFIVGLLVAPSNTFLLAAISSLITIAAPLPILGTVNLGAHQLFSIVLTFLSALLAAQSTGELYAVTEWALHNYQKERKTTEALFENRQLLERSLIRTQALSEQLQETNQQLEVARAAAE